VSIQMKATEQYFPVVLSLMPYKVVLTFESGYETLKCNHSNAHENCSKVLSCSGPCLTILTISSFCMQGVIPC